MSRYWLGIMVINLMQTAILNYKKTREILILVSKMFHMFVIFGVCISIKIL